MPLDEESMKRIFAELKREALEGARDLRRDPSQLGLDIDHVQHHNCKFGWNPVPEYRSLAAQLIDVFATSVLAYPEFPKGDVTLRVETGLCQYIPDPELGSPMFDPPEPGEDPLPEFQFFVNLYTSLAGNPFLPFIANRSLMEHILETSRFFMQDWWGDASVIYSTDKLWFVDYPGKMRLEGVPGLGERLPGGRLNFPRSEFQVEVTEELRAKARILLAYHQSGGDSRTN